MIRAVIDTNVLVSGLIAPMGNEALILPAAHQQLVLPCCSEAILREYEDVLGRPKFAFAPDESAALLEMFRTKGDRVESLTAASIFPDPEDANFLQCPEAAFVGYIVTGNKRHFPLDACGLIRIVGAGELLDWITLTP